MTKERANIFRLAEHLHTPVGALLRQMTSAELISWGLLADYDHQQKELAEFRKAQAFSNG